MSKDADSKSANIWSMCSLTHTLVHCNVSTAQTASILGKQSK